MTGFFLSVLLLLPTAGTANDQNEYQGLPPVYLEPDSVAAEPEQPVLSARADSTLQGIPECGMPAGFQMNVITSPWILTGYRNLDHSKWPTTFPDPESSRLAWRHADTRRKRLRDFVERGLEELDSIEMRQTWAAPDKPDLLHGSPEPAWMKHVRDSRRIQEDAMHALMVKHFRLVDFVYSDLPLPPKMPDEETTMSDYLLAHPFTDDNLAEKVTVENLIKRTNWLHTFDFKLQLSQGYISDNWYQGGTSYLALVGQLLWDVTLNPAYYKKRIFQSTLSYHVGINSSETDKYHKYLVSQDIFQYNLKLGYKAVRHWYYSFIALFKTQLLHNYPANSPTRNASFLSPGELNVGLGLTYSKENAARTLRFSASISPVSYDIKTCIDSHVDRAQFGIKPDRRWKNEVGSNAEINFYAKFWGNTTYTTRLFLFTDYEKFQGDWENTLNFQFSRLFSTQIYAHLRYDTSVDSSISRKWRKLMLKEILSVGISYNFSTK